MSDNPSPLPPPILHAREFTPEVARVGVLVFTRSEEPPAIEAVDGEAGAPEPLYSRSGITAWGAELCLPAANPAHYAVDGKAYPVVTDLAADCRIAFVSCNGETRGDADRDVEERNVMWRRLAKEHTERPFGLMLQGGDQIYADDMGYCHPTLSRWSKVRPRRRQRIEMTEEMAETAEDWLFNRYLTLTSAPEVGRLQSTIASLMMWDDHDILDGWGSHPEEMLSSPIGRGFFEIARRMFRLFQRGLHPEGETPEYGFTTSLALPGAHFVAPDLRSGRTLDQVMPECGWKAFEAELDAVPPGVPLFLLSTVPLLGPRLSWVEALISVLPGAQEYEDDLRDQWQSRAHRTEWQRALRLMEREIEERGRIVTALSGEIHLATRAEMHLPSGKVMHQLVSSGIAHPEPHVSYPRVLGLLASVGEAPLEGRPIVIRPLPGRWWTYTRERNWLMLVREDGRWRARWETERMGATEWLELTSAA